jgi:hypothetical protein
MELQSQANLNAWKERLLSYISVSDEKSSQ